MRISKTQFERYVKSFQLRELFIDLGWNNDKGRFPILIENNAFEILKIAEKSGFRILICPPDSKGSIPDYSTRKKIENRISQLFQEHIVIYVDALKKEQVWQTRIRKKDGPAKTVETKYKTDQSPELLYQKASGLFFTLDEEENITIVDVTERVGKNFAQNSEKVTKKFYDGFKKEHTAFIGFIKGIDDKFNIDWYASLMLNRLMFCYFIQKKGFLDNNRNYLKDKLNLCKTKKGENKFYSFYRNFLLVLFHNGLGAPEHSKNLLAEVGRVPYLNGGLFDVHEIEKTYKHIDISDDAFERIFDFFDKYEWHLDTKADATGNEINPDVIGYIFEKYINDRADMGAYYTKEDITEYIGKNCIIPYIFDSVKRAVPDCFEEDSFIWETVKNSGDRYIYPSVKKGVPEGDDIFSDLPDEIKKGFNTELEQKVVDGKGVYLCDLRDAWNTSAPETIALPTEIYREVIERRKRCRDLRDKINSGGITEINDFITFNLNIRQFAQDIIENTDNADLLTGFYRSLSEMTILDPTCGSGAFLFAALNILEPLYEACILRMRAFVEDEDRTNKEEKPAFYNKHRYFREVLEKLQSPEHPNLQYFIYKSIILNNLYGVDIMKEAVEIAKLRLFLKLVSTVDPVYRKPNIGLEPLPDIDFNIRSGNTLIGFANENELDDALTLTVDGLFSKPQIERQMTVVSDTFKRYKDIQLKGAPDYEEFKRIKDFLYSDLANLNNTLNGFLHKKDYSNVKYEKWLETHKPFHWFAEFYEIINGKGGFDVIIGNPPYVEYSKIRGTYILCGFETGKCNNLYGYVVERSYNVLKKTGIVGMIIPISAFSNSSMESLQKYFYKFNLTYLSNFHQRPAALFEGVLQRLSIFISYKEKNESGVYSTNVLRWKSENRNLLFQSIFYVKDNQNHRQNTLKIGFGTESKILKKYYLHNAISILTSNSPVKENSIYYRTAGGGYWVTILNAPFKTKSLSNKSAFFEKRYDARVISVILNSNLFWWYYSINFDQFNFKDYMLFGFRFNYPSNSAMIHRLVELSDRMEYELLKNATEYTINSRTRGANQTITYNKYYSKNTMDCTDKALAEHYGFTHEELDFIMNYDIKYRMGKELEDDND